MAAPHSYLILIRHGKSTYNDLGLWCGWTDVDLHEAGRDEAKAAAEHLRDIDIHVAYTSKLKRAKQTFALIQEALEKADIAVHEHEALNERDYGVYTGKNKWQIKEEVGEETFTKIRRSWDHPIPEGETLKDVYARVSKYYDDTIKPELLAGKNVLLSAHGNSLRALVKHLEYLNEEQIAELEIGTCEVHIYEMDIEGKIIGKQIRGQKENTV